MGGQSLLRLVGWRGVMVPLGYLGHHYSMQNDDVLVKRSPLYTGCPSHTMVRSVGYLSGMIGIHQKLQDPLGSYGSGSPKYTVGS